MLIKFLESIQYLGEVVSNMNFTGDFFLFLLDCEKIYQIPLIAIFKHNVYHVLLTDDVFNLDDVLVLP